MAIAVRTQTIPLASITGGMQARAGMDNQTVQEYAEALRTDAGRANWPPIVVFEGKLPPCRWLADGFHRVAAAKLAGITELLAEIREGGQWDALRYALSANGTHGLRRGRADVQKAIRMAYENRKDLGLPEVPSARLVGELVGVSEHTATAQLAQFAGWRDAQARTGMDGKTRPVPPPRPVPPVPPPAPPAKGPDGTAGTDETEGERRFGPPPPPVRQEIPGMPPGRAVILDAVGREVPPEKLELWQRRQETQDLLTMLSRVRGAVRQYQDRSDPLFAQVNYSSLMAHLDQAYADLEVGKPYAVCPSCQGLLGCRLCGGSGLLSKFRWDTCVSREQKKAVAGGQEA